MATTISIQVAGVTASRTFANDSKAQATLLAFRTAFGLDGTTNQEKLLAVVDWFTGFVQNKAVLKYVEDARATTESEAGNTYGFA
jgi:hypothetical protein